MAQTKGQRQPNATASIANRATDKVGAAAPIKSAVNHFEAHLGTSPSSTRKFHLDSLRHHVAVKMKPLRGIRVASLQIISQKTCARAASNFVKTPLVIGEGVLCGLCAKRGQTAVG